MTDFEALLRTLDKCEVDYIVAGGAAALAHGASGLTQDLEIVYSRSSENLDPLISALRDAKPCLRGAPPGLPFLWDRSTLNHGLNFTLETSLGMIDLLGEIPGSGTYDDLVGGTVELKIFSGTSKCLSPGQLIRARRAAGRPKDLEVLAGLEALREETSEE